jgi:hypothetical protein
MQTPTWSQTSQICIAHSIGAATERNPSGGTTSRKRMKSNASWAISSLEDKIVHYALVKILDAIYETDFLRFSRASWFDRR